MSSVNYLMKIDVVDQQDMYLICSHDEHKNHLRIILLNHNECKAFSGRASDYELMTQAAVISMIFSDFMSLTLKALTNCKSSDDKFLYCLEKNCECFVFKWKSIDKEESIISLGNIKVSECDYKTATIEAFLLLSEEMVNLKEKLTLANENIADLKKEVDNSLHLLVDINIMKERIENELYSKFILVLNEKKQKIRDLKRGRDDASSCNTNKRQKSNKNSSRIHNISDSSAEDVSDSDLNILGPSTSKCNNSLPFFDDDEFEMKISPSKKRTRNNFTVPKISACPVDKPKAKQQIIESGDESDDLFDNL